MELNNKIIKATKWASITEIIAKLISPITNMILARILAPEEFGVLATITMIISFVDMFTDAGFQKYLIQHEFNNEEEKNITTNVAFWSNLSISITLWIIIIIFSEKIAILVGNPGLGKTISIACIQLPLTSFSSIQMAIYRREFDYKTLFSIRIISIFIPFIITIPLAFLEFSYWSLIIGNTCGILFNAIILTIKSNWKPKLQYNITVLKKMLSFSIWSLIESISIWFTTWVDTFIIGSVLSSYYLGVYKTSLTTVNGIFSLVTASTTPILFSALSRVQNNSDEFNKIYFRMQKMVAYLVLPMSVGMFIYSDLVVKIFLGEKWGDAARIVGIWALISGLVIVLAHYSSEVYRAKGKPKLSFLAQLLHLVVLIPVCMIAARGEFYDLVNARALIRIQFIIIHILIIKYIIGISIINIFKNIYIPLISSILMGIISLILKYMFSNFIWELFSIFISMMFYLTLLFSFKKSRKDLITIFKKMNFDF